MDKSKNRSIVTGKGIYLCLLTVYALLREVLVIQKIVGSSIITYGFFGAGILLMVTMILFDKQVFLRKSQWLPMVFLLICCVSTVVNRRFDFMSNVKAIAWMSLYFMLLLPESRNAEAEKQNQKWIMITAVATMVVLVLISLPMYYFNVDYTYVKASGFPNNQGFSRLYMRLWGIFNDANATGVYSLVCICFSIYLFTKTKKLIYRILLGVACVLLFQMTALTNSKTALVSLLVASTWGGVYFIFCGKSNTGRRVLSSVMAAVIAAGAAYGAYATVKLVTPYGKLAIQSITKPSLNMAVHQAYDRLFQHSGLNITDGYYESEIVAAEPSITESEQEQAPLPPAQMPAPSTQVTTPPEVEALERADKKADLSNGRFQKWQEVLEVFRHMPIFGASPRGISFAARQINPNSSVGKFSFAAHNSFLEILAGTGAIGFVIALAILLWLAWDILRVVFSVNGCSELFLYSTVLLIIVCEMMFISDVFFVLTFGGIAFWLAAGRIFAITTDCRKHLEKE